MTGSQLSIDKCLSTVMGNMFMFCAVRHAAFLFASPSPGLNIVFGEREKQDCEGPDEEVQRSLAVVKSSDHVFIS